MTTVEMTVKRSWKSLVCRGILHFYTERSVELSKDNRGKYGEMVVKIPSLSQYHCRLLHIERSEEPWKGCRKGRENPQFVTVFYTSSHSVV